MHAIPHSRPWITEVDGDAVHRCAASGMVAKGALVAEFERRMAQHHGAADAVAFSSGTAALAGVLMALGVRGRQVVAPTYVCGSVLEAVRLAGAEPRLCDVGDETWNMTPRTVQACLGPRTAAIIAVHIFGIPCDVRGIARLGLPVIEDCAQALGSEWEGEKVGSAGDAAIFSFHGTKCLTTGEGGMALSRNPEILERLRRPSGGLPGEVTPMSDLQAALGLSQLARYGAFLDKRRQIASRYFEVLPEEVTGRLRRLARGAIFFRFPLWVDATFERMERRMHEAGVAVRRGVDRLLHRTTGVEDQEFPNATECFRRTLCLPIYPSLEEHDTDRAAAAAVRSLTEPAAW